jgi:hypothetical protein
MASSKFYHEEVLVPETVIRLAKKKPNVVFCNLRDSQRPKPEGQDETEYVRSCLYSDGVVMHYPVVRFLKGICHDLTRVALVYQGYGTEVSTIVRDLPPINCWAEGIPRLDFSKPEKWNHCINFWGTFILAIAQVDHKATEVMNDPDFSRFIEIIDTYGIASTLPDRIMPDRSTRKP